MDFGGFGAGRIAVEAERCLPPLVVGGAQAPMRERAAKAKG